MTASPPERTSWQDALAATAVDPRATVTREQMARLAEDATVAAPPPPDVAASAPHFAPPRAADLPLVDLALTARAPAAPSEDPGSARPPGAGADLAISRLLAEGGMGRVFLADQRSLAREVAIKTVRDPGDPAQVEALLWEGAIAGHLDHPGVTPVHLLGANRDGQPLLVMKRIVGTRWTDLIDGDDAVWARFPMLPRDRLRAHLEILMEVARTVHFAHRRGIIHLDLKPDNVMIGELGEVYVVDWGVALPCPQGGLCTGFVGTPLFVAPEVVAAERVGPWTDVYLLGATLHVVLTGAPRHPGEGLVAILAAARASAPWDYPPGISRELAALANRTTARDPAARPADALAFRGAIATHLEHTAALDLARGGERRLARATGEGAPETRADPAEPEEARQLAAEARFAFREALERWPECHEARAGLERALIFGAELELERENLPAAMDLERELAAPPPALVARREALERVLTARAESAEELRRLRHDADLSRGSGAQVRLLLALVALSVVGLAAMWLLGSAGLLGALEPMAPPVGGLLVFSIGVWWLRRSVLQNAANRRLVVFFLATIVFLGAHRAGTIFFPLDAAAAEVRSELLIGAALTLGLATFLTRRLALLPVCAIAGAALVTILPRYADAVFNTAAFGMLLALIVVLRGERGADG